MAAKVNKQKDNWTATHPNSRYKITLRRDVCIGAASCITIADKTFDLDGDNIVIYKDGDWDEDDIILAAAQSCPVFAIEIVDLKTGKVIFPEPE